MPSLILVLSLVFAVAALFRPNVNADSEQFYGGSMSFTMKKRADGNNEVTIELITGWVLGRGPCGAACSKADIGHSTRPTRINMLSSSPGYFGNYTADYLNKTTHTTVEMDMKTAFTQSYNGTVIAMSSNAKWEQELLHFSTIMPDSVEALDINFNGMSWRKLAKLQVPTLADVAWHFQIKISSAIRSDTGKTNESPRSISKPFYRIKLGKATSIQIPAVDADRDFIKCELAAFIEGGDISKFPPPHVTIHENCSIVIDATVSNNYTDDTWIAVPVSVSDYNREKIDYGDQTYQIATYSLSTTAVQFLVQVLANLTTPEFVDPTCEGNHVFIMYADTTWRTDIYAEATENTTIESFTAFGIQQEILLLSQKEQDPKRAQVTKTTMSWKPTNGDIGRHIACVSASDNTGVDSAEQRCFILDVQADVFNHTTTIAVGKPYFVDIPSPNQFVECKVKATCVVALYVHSTVEVTDVSVTQTDINKYDLGPIQLAVHKGEHMYQVDLSFEHSSHGKEDICFKAKDKIGQESELVCIRSQIEPPDPCASAPCANSGTCETDFDSGGFKCLCLSKYSGKTCAIKEDPCKPDPCVKGNNLGCMNLNGILCWCKPGFTGPTCDTNINDCISGACNGRGTCKDKANGYDCECNERYNGTHCENDKCPAQSAGVMTCPTVGCSPNTCHGQGVCSAGGLCSCPFGFNGLHCETRQCNIPGAVNDVEIISPSVEDGSTLICYTKETTILPCSISIYLAVKQGSSPSISVDTTLEMQRLISIGQPQKSPVIPGLSNMYTAEVKIRGSINSTKSHYVCVSASSGISESSACYEISFTKNPEDDTTTLAHAQINAAVKFLPPTPKDRSTILCNTNDICRILLYTSFSSNRPSCNVSSTSYVAASSGSTSSGRCDKDDKDNDEDDPDPAKSTDPCCKDVISSTSGVTVYPAHPRGSSCVAEASFTFPNEGENDICFQSAASNYQQVCYKVAVYEKSSDPCSNSSCQNNGHCFRTDHSSFKCYCPDKYTGDKCEKGPCQQTDNNCQNDAYCQTNDGVATCICKAGYSGKACNQDPASLTTKTLPGFTDTARPRVFICVLHQKCSVALILTGQPVQIPTVTPGYVHPSLQLEEIETVDRQPVKSSYQTNIRLKPFELGDKDLCIQTKDINGVNKDEYCFVVKVISDVISIYGFKDRPHFVEPSLPANAEMECIAEEPCHVLYHVTPGQGNENECLTFYPHPPDGFVNFHLFSSCDTCKPGDHNNGNCTVDVSLVNSITDVGVKRHFCLALGLIGSTTAGETRCFNLTVEDKNDIVKEGCQKLECKNGGFCNGHVSGTPSCTCTKGFSDPDCGKAEVKSSRPVSQKLTFIGDFTVLSEIKCVVNTRCPIPFQVISEPGITPIVSLGNVDPRISVENPVSNAISTSSTMYEGKAVAEPKQVGVFKVCLQANVNSKTDDELCVTIDVISSVVDKVDQTKPYFLPPTVTSDSTVLCEVDKSCHFNMHFTKGDGFGFPGKCPTLAETSPSLVAGVHIFDSKLETADCTADVSYIPPVADGEHTLCVQVALPGKKGEIICYTVKIATNISKEVIAPCRGVSCENSGKCLADFSSTPPNSSCICKTGFTGGTCGGVVSKSTDLPGIENLNVSLCGNQHFDVYTAIPTDVKCEVNHDCCINIPYYGEDGKPPIIGYIDDSKLSIRSQNVIPTSSLDPSFHISQICVNGTTGGSHRLCEQTSTDGTDKGINIDEMCFNITIEPDSKNHSTSGSHFSKSIPDGSTVLCKPNTVCHIPVITSKQSDGNCSQPSECGDGVPGVHVFQTNMNGGDCVTDVAIKTGNIGALNLCIASGSKGQREERHLKVEVDNSSSFGPCQKLHCVNGGSCVAEHISSPVCRCHPGYTGSLCETDIDECSTDPCENDGTCVDEISNYTCACDVGFTGRNCETRNNCQNGGTCVDGIKSCVDGYTGRNCETNINECGTNLCQNGGTCVDGINNYTCKCVDGYTGHINECTVSNCQNGGTCVDGINKYTCKCVTGYTGHNCETDINECSTNRCQNGGTCVDGINNFTCKCVDGYTGRNCETNINECTVSNCQNGGTCVDGINKYTCKCVTGYTGHNCETDINECSTNLCQNGGICVDGINSYSCNCVTGYTGPNCETDINECGTNHCQNGGTCVDGINNYTCKCVDGYTGRNCETNINECNVSNCQNGGTCVDGINKYTCKCVTGYTGDYCETDINECSTNLCQNGGTCVDGINSYSCKCVDGYTGPNCETTIKQSTTVSTTLSTAASTTPSTASTTLSTAASTTPSTASSTLSTAASSTLSTTTSTTPSTTPATPSTMASSTLSTTATATQATTASTTPPITASTTQSTAASSTQSTTVSITQSTTGSTTPSTTLKSCVCIHGKCDPNRCICAMGWSGDTCAKSGGTRTHTGVQTSNDTLPPAFTEFVIPQVIPCKIHEYCTIILPVDGKPCDQNRKPNMCPKVEHGTYDHGLNVTPEIEVKPAFTCTTQAKCPYEAAISVSPTQLRIYKYCVQTKDYLGNPADELCYKIQGTPNDSTPNKTSIFMYPPTLPENSTMSCSHNQTCHYQLEIKKVNGTCDPKLRVDPTSSSVLVFQSNVSNSSSCRYDVVYIPPVTAAGKQDLCFSPQTSPQQKHCMVVDVPETCDTKKASEHAREMVITGYASCFCVVNNQKVQIIKKRPVVPKEKLFKAAGFGAGGMAGTMVVGVIVYAIVNKIRQPAERKKPPTPRPPPAAPRQRSRIHPQQRT